MTTNTNTKTGIRYGVTDARNHMELWDEIIANGTDESWEHFKRETIKALQNAIENACDIGHYTSEAHDKELQDIAEETFDALMDRDLIHYESDESEYSYDDGKGFKCQITYLGGAPLLWIIESPRIVYIKSLCSPCVPNAGDLDSGIVAEFNPDDPSGEGYACYGVPLEWCCQDEVQS